MTETDNLVVETIERFGRSRGQLLPILQEIVKTEHYLSEDALKTVAEELDLSPADVYGVASFYSFLDLKPRGENCIRVCKSITCYMKGKDQIIKAIESRLKIRLGETTPNNRFSFIPVNCIGWCHKGPAMLINEDVYTELTPEKAVEAIESYI